MSTWLTENPEMLQVALEIVGTWEEGTSLSETTRRCPPGPSNRADNDSDSISSKGASGRPLLATRLVVNSAKIDARRSRRLQPSTIASTHHRRQQEIKSLQAMAVELERQLQSLQHTDSVGEKACGTDTSAWWGIARQQQQRRRVSEAKQLSLRRRVDVQLKLGVV